jgi:hypothetical protein
MTTLRSLISRLRRFSDWIEAKSRTGGIKAERKGSQPKYGAAARKVLGLDKKSPSKAPAAPASRTMKQPSSSPPPSRAGLLDRGTSETNGVPEREWAVQGKTIESGLAAAKSAFDDLGYALKQARPDEIAKHQVAIKSLLESLAKSVGMTVSDKNASGNKKQMPPREQLLVLADKIRTEGSFSDDAKNTIKNLAADVPLREWVSYAKSIGSKGGVSSRPDAYLTELLESMTGVSSLPFDQSAVDRTVDELQQFYNSSLNEVKDEGWRAVARSLRKLDLGTLYKAGVGFGIQDLKKDRAEIIRRIKAKMYATSRSRNGNRV